MFFRSRNRTPRLRKCLCSRSSSFLIGFSSFLLGLIWLSHPEPWILDRVPNEEILGLSFKELFTSDINKSLPDYLRVVYRFFAYFPQKNLAQDDGGNI